MSTLFLGGDISTGGNSIVLTRCDVLDYHREPIFHGPDYIYTRHSLRIRALYNPGVNAWTLSPQFTQYAAPSVILRALGFNTTIVQRDSGPVTAVARTFGNANAPNSTLPSESGGLVAPITDVAIRHWIERPRQRIVLVMGGVPLLVTPNINSDGTVAACDVKGGPFITANDVVYISGGKSFEVDFSVETFVNEAGIFQATPNVLLSHRWEPTEDIDQDYFGTRTIQGRAHFRMDRLAFLGAAADEFRSFLVAPLPFFGWKRVAAHFQISDDGSTLDYALVDKELALSIIPQGVTRIEAYQTIDVDTGNRFGAATTLAGAAHDFAVAGGFEFAGGVIGLEGLLVGNPTAIAEIAIAMSRNAVEFGRAARAAAAMLIPKTVTTIVARVWGRSDVGRKALENTALAIVTNRLDRCIAQFGLFGFLVQFAGTTSVRLTHDLAGKFVEATCTRDFPIPPNPVKQIAATVPKANLFFPDDDETNNVLTIFHGNVTPLGLPNYPNSQNIGSRGTTLMKLAVAALLAPDATPAVVTINGVPQNLTPS